MASILAACMLILGMFFGYPGNIGPMPIDGQNKPASDQIIEFYFYYPSGSMPDNDFTIMKDDKSIMLTARGGPYGSHETMIDEKALSDLQGLIMEHNIFGWNGFDEKAEDSLLTTANMRFRLQVVYEDLAMIAATGDHAFPEGYQEAEKALLEFFGQLLQ